MIANRFRAVGLVAGISAAALTCYLVSLQVAAERAQLMKVERQILAARADIRQLAMELDTRSRLVQLERWNTDVLGLKAPAASQYAANAVQLAAYAAPRMIAPVVQAVAVRPAVAATPRPVEVATYRAPPPSVPAVSQSVAYRPAMPSRPVVETVAYRAPAPVRPVVQKAAFAPTVVIAAPVRPLLQKAAMSAAPAVPKPARPAALLSDDMLAGIDKAAAQEKARR